MRRMLRAIALCLSFTLLTACHERAPADPVVVDGSSTAFPLAEAVAHEFMKANKGTAINVAFSGTGTGFVKFCRGQLDIANASRPITVDEQKACESANVAFVELPVAHDAITIVVNSKNTWASSITVPELRILWDAAAEKQITTWNRFVPSGPIVRSHCSGPELNPAPSTTSPTRSTDAPASAARTTAAVKTSIARSLVRCSSTSTRSASSVPR